MLKEYYENLVKLNNKNKDSFEKNNFTSNEIERCKNINIYSIELDKFGFFLTNNSKVKIKIIGNDITTLVDFLKNNRFCYIKNISFLKDKMSYFTVARLDNYECYEINRIINKLGYSTSNKIDVFIKKDIRFNNTLSKAILMGGIALYVVDFKFAMFVKDNRIYILSCFDLVLYEKPKKFLNDLKCASLYIDNLDISNLIDVDAFFESSLFEKLFWKNIDSKKVVSCSKMFYMCIYLKELDIKELNTSKVQNFSAMFAGCSSLVTLDINNFDTIKGTTFYCMFEGCTSLQTLVMNNCRTSAGIVTSYANMFNHCHRLENLDWKNFYKHNCNIMEYGMFEACPFPKYFYINGGKL